MTRFQRVYETAVFRTLGAGSRLLLLMSACEYFLLGLLAGLIGSVAAVALSWYATSRILTLPWLAYPAIVGAGILLTALLVTVVGVAANADTLRHRPLAALRAE
jgi:putative ABC transport system permease protein